MGKQIQSEEPVLEESEPVEVEAETEEVENVVSEVQPDETPEESVREALAELRQEDKTDTGDQGEAIQGNNVGINTPKPSGKEITEPTFQPDDFEPPSRLTAAEKQIFNKLPKRFKPAVARMFKEHQSHFTKTQQELDSKVYESKHIVEAVRPYYVTHPELAEMGLSESGLVSSLIAAHQKLTSREKDPQSGLPMDKATILALARDRGYQIKFVGDSGEEEVQNGNHQTDILSHPEFKRLHETVNQLSSSITQQRVQAAASPIIRDFESIRDEKDNLGNYRYPKLHEDAFWERAKPLVSALAQTGLNYSEALKRAYLALEGPPQQPNQTGLSVNNHIANRAVSAASSVRGHVAPPIRAMSADGSVPSNETPEQSARIALEELRRSI